MSVFSLCLFSVRFCLLVCLVIKCCTLYTKGCSRNLRPGVLLLSPWRIIAIMVGLFIPTSLTLSRVLHLKVQRKDQRPPRAHPPWQDWSPVFDCVSVSPCRSSAFPWPVLPSGKALGDEGPEGSFPSTAPWTLSRASQQVVLFYLLIFCPAFLVLLGRKIDENILQLC